MLLMILLAMLFAKFKHYKIKTIFLTWTFYPAFVVELVYVFFQINVFLGNYYFVQFAPFFKTATLYVYLIPMLAFKLYKSGLIGSGFIVIGTVLNKFVMAQNGGKMPVYPSLSYITGYAKPNAFTEVTDIHILGDVNTKWKILTDYIDIGYSILSVGDLFIHSFAFIITYSLIKATNEKKEIE